MKNQHFWFPDAQKPYKTNEKSTLALPAVLLALLAATLALLAAILALLAAILALLATILAAILALLAHPVSSQNVLEFLAFQPRILTPP